MIPVLTYGEGLETRVEEISVEDGCTGLGDEDGFAVDEDG